jgi:5'-3' exoribonuclease 1
MGIPSYFSYIVKNHATVIRKLDSSKFKTNNLYLDANSIIYDCVHKIDFTKLAPENFEIIYQAVFDKIDEYITLISPDSNIFIAFDGTAPVAKLEQQRQRRHKSLYQNKIAKTILKRVEDPWNTTAITPGTKFMIGLNETLRKKYTNPSKYNVKNIILSPSDKYGEGEHKLFDYIRTFPDQHLNKNTVIYGLDADLIMLSINHLPVNPNIYLFRETPEFIKSINSELDPNESYMIDIPELAKIITLNMNNGEPLTTEQQANRIYDYIFMCFFLGNDFMPHFPSVNIRTGGVDKMINAYKATIGNTAENLTNGKTIYWKNVRKLVQFLADAEEVNFKKETALRDRRENQPPIGLGGLRGTPVKSGEDELKKFEAIPTYERKMEKFINPFNNNWQRRYYKTLFNVDIDDVRRKQICVNYLEGLEWTMKYYTTGCADWRWCYNYDYPPLLCDLIHYIPYFETEFIVKKKPAPVNELVQLCYVLPKEYLQLLPTKICDRVLSEYSHWYISEQECEYVWAYCRYFWESHAQLPEIDINELEKFILPLLEKVEQKYLPS